MGHFKQNSVLENNTSTIDLDYIFESLIFSNLLSKFTIIFNLSRHWLKVEPHHFEPQGPFLSTKVSFVRFDLADWKLPGNNLKLLMLNSVFSVTSHIRTIVKVCCFFIFWY